MKSLHRTTYMVLSVGVAATLALTACAPEDTTEETEQAEDTEQQDTEAADEPTDPEADGDGAGQHPVYEAIDSVLSEYPDGVITEFEDNSGDDGYVEIYVYDGQTEWEVEVNSESFEIVKTEDEGIDDDDRDKAEAVSIELTEALQTAEEESGGQPHEGELDTEDGSVVWELEMDNDVELYVDVTTGEVLEIDR